MKLIQPVPVVRDENGYWDHPDEPDFDENHEAFKAWLVAQGLEIKQWHMDADISDPHPYDDGAAHCPGWEPVAPGHEWFLLGIFDSEDGPCVSWVRRKGVQAWSLNGDDGSWDYPNLMALLRDNFGSAADGTSFGSGLGNGLKVGDTVKLGGVCKADPAGFLPDADAIVEHMFEEASGSDAGEWVDNYPDLDEPAKVALEKALEPLRVWAREHCEPQFFTIEGVSDHVVTAEDVRLARAYEVMP